MEAIDKILHDFLVESQENLQRLDQNFVELEREPGNQELLGDIFRSIHSIKGSAGFLNFPTLEQISHDTEEVLARLRNQTLTLDEDMITVLLHSVDCIKSILVHLEKTGEEGEHNMRAVTNDLHAIIDGTWTGKPPIIPLPEPETLEVSRERAEETGAKVQQELVPAATIEAAQAVQKGGEDRKVKTAQAQKVAEVSEPAAATVEDSRIHVDVKLLDQLMNLTGELVLARNRVMQFVGAEEIDALTFRNVAEQLNVVVSELQETVMKTRMQPVKKVFGMLPRLVRDQSRAYGKDVVLKLEGQETELDRTLLEVIKDPLTHLVRNAIAHGIETPEERRKQGKPSTGAISITASHQGGQVHIDITDDGAGIALAAVKTKAVNDGLITAQRAEEMGDRDVLNLIFRAGFSTSKTVTSMSGRGVGMDVVKRNLHQIGGTVDIRTEAGTGTTITLRIPITLAIIPVLLVTAGGQRFAIPQVNLEELVMLQADNGGGHGIEEVYGAEVYRLRGELLPLLRLNQVLRLPEAETQQPEISIVVVSAGMTRFGMIVDEVGDTEEIVVKPLSGHVRQILCYDGATIMGDGKVALILNMSGLFTVAQFNIEDLEQSEGERQAEVVEAAGEQKQTIVLFRAGENEYYGVPLVFVTRLEEFPRSQIEHSGGREVLQYRGDILPLMRLEPYLNLPALPDPEKLALIVFSVDKQIGLAVQEVINTVEISTHIDTETFQQKGILGSTIVEGHSVLMLDIHGLIELAYPSWYKKFFVSTLSDAEREQIRVLLVEDSAFFLNIEKSYLESAGYQVMTAWHGQEALEKLETETVDVVVTDIAMPYCDGYELTKRLRAREEWKHLPVMAVTALSGEEDRRKGIEAGIDEYKIKLDREEVLRALEQLIIRYRRKGQ